MTGSLLKVIWAPLILLVFIGTLYAGSLLGLLPSSTELSQLLAKAFLEYGWPLVLLCSIAENLAGINGYVPGAFTILSAMAMTSGRFDAAVTMYLAIYSGSVIGNVGSFFLGRLQRAFSSTGVISRGWLRVLLTYWHPQLASITAFEFGMAGAGLRQLLRAAVPISLFWSLLYAVVLYRYGFPQTAGDYFIPAFAIYLFVWLLIRVISFFRVKQRTRIK